MPTIKRWSTGPLGNIYPDHSERNNPNTRGLSLDGIPGVEGYIEEDRVVADQDNRPLINLVQNDQILENNLSSVASEVDYGVLRGKNNELKIEVLQKGIYKNPEEENELIEITPIRVNSGQAIVDGQVVSIGNQKIIYFLKDDGSYIFPDYNEHIGKIVVPISDDLYTGEYRPIYDTVPSGLPENFSNYEIKIVNKYDNKPDRNIYFKTYRDWEDIIPYSPHTEENETNLNFIYDKNYGRESEGVWLSGDNVSNVKVSNVVVKKDITVSDKLLSNEKFIKNGDSYEQYITTDGIFFDNIPFKTDQVKRDIQDLYAANNGDLYFIYKHKEANESLYYLPIGSSQATNISLLNLANQSINKLVEINNILYILGTNGYIAKYNLINNSGSIMRLNIVDDNFNNIILFQNKIWLASDKKIYIIENDSIYDIINFDTEIDTISNKTNIVEKINTLLVISGNFFVDSSLKTNIKNYIKNPSFESGGIGQLPIHWEGEGVINPSNAKYGNYKVILQPNQEITQTIYSQFNIGDITTLSIHCKSLLESNLQLTIDDGIANNKIITCNNINWERFYLTHTITSSNNIVIKIKNTSSNIIQLDAIQFELGDMNQFVEGYEYLFIGFKKSNVDLHNPPFAFIDSKRLNQINYSVGKYGFINTVNAVKENQNNNILFVDDTNLYSLTILNDEDEYNRISITNLTKENKNFQFDNRIEQFKTLEIFDDRILFGGSILNKTISFNLLDKNEHIINFIQPNDISIKDYLDPNISSYYNILDLLGSYKIINAHDNIGINVEFSRVDNIYENRSLIEEPGVYFPGRYYLFILKIDDNEPIIIDIQMPQLYNGPISVENIYNMLIQRYNEKYQNQLIKLNLIYSRSRVDGLYSIGKNKVTRHIRGNVNKIFKQNNIDKQNHYNKGIYIILDSSILRSKYDSNIKKSDDGIYINKPDIVGEVDYITQLPQIANIEDIYCVKDFGYYKWNGQIWTDTNYIHKWDLNQSDHSLREFKNKYNQLILFTDESVNKNWINIPVTPGYKLLPGSLRVKTNQQTEIGFSENEDYFVDYESSKIIRSTLTNLINDSNFEHVDTPSTHWQKYLTLTTNSVLHLNKKFDSYKTFNGEEKITNLYASAYIESTTSNSGAIYQYITPKSLNIGDTYTFSIKLKTNKFKTGTIKIAERTNKTAVFNTSNGFSEKQYIISDEADKFNEWHTYIVSHTITSSQSKHLRVEININVENIYEQLFMKEAQLERNQIATPYVKEILNSRIDPGLTVYIDFTESRDLINNIDYIFDINNRKVVYYGEINNDTKLYFDYKYEKIFNPYLFETAIPKFDVGYDVRDDYFLYLYAGRIWAINFVLSLLSQDEENPLIISYKYHNQRIDKIKIRNVPDQYGNYVYIVKGIANEINPYAPYDKGTDKQIYTVDVSRNMIEDVKSNDTIYAINVFDFDFNNNDIYNRKIYVDSKDNRFYNISLYDQTAGYFPYTKDFMSTSGMNPINRLYSSKIVDIIKNFEIKQLEEIGAWGNNYQLTLRNLHAYPATSISTFVDVDHGNDNNNGELFLPLKTIKEALKRIKSGAAPYIIVKSQSLITEDVEIDLAVSQVRIFAQSYARWNGNIQNKTPVLFQGFQFENHNNYVIESVEYSYCTFINSTVNNYIPVDITFNKCKIEDGKNTFLHIKNTIYPSPFIHPYMRNVSADDNIAGIPESVATSDSESIHPGVNYYNKRLVNNPEATYKFFRCLINDMGDNIVKYDLNENENWISKFIFNRSTIVNNKNIFYTNKASQDILYNECIIWNNGETRFTEKKYFDSFSNILFQNCYLDINLIEESANFNFNLNGLLFGRETCINGLDFEPGFVSTQKNFENYRLRSEAMGFLVNSVCIGKSADGRDLGCYDELRERLDVEVPKKLKSYFALLGEGIHYPIVLNSEKITFSLEFKPSNPFSMPAVLFDTRSSIDDKDYIVVCYNNNTNEKIVDIEPDINAEINDPYTFKIIVSNEKIKYAVISPIEIYSDSDYQIWHKLSFTINYEKTYNEKAAFDEKDKYQNIITLYHNEELSVESFLKNDLNYDDRNNMLHGKNSDNTNSWNYNNISKFITIGSAYNQQYILNGYYSELRIDNKFINRKELEIWNKKIVPFNDPTRYIDQNNLARTFDSSIINELWTLKTKYDMGMKGKHFNKNTYKRFTYDESELTWVLTNSTTNFIDNSDLSRPIFASITTDVPPNNDTENLFPITFNGIMNIKTIGGNSFDSIGININFGTGKQFYSHDEIYNFLIDELNKPIYVQTKLQIFKLKDNRFRIITRDYLATQIEINFENGGDGDDFGFETESGQGNGYYVIANANGSKTISNSRDNTSIVIISGINQDMQTEHNAWLEFDPEYNKFSSTSLGISRIITNNNKDDVINDQNEHKYIRFITNRRLSGSNLGIYNENDISPKEYTYSTYIYRKSNTFHKNDVNVIIIENDEEKEYEFDSITNICGYWWLASKTLQIKSDPQAKIGLIIKGEIECYFNAFQLEEGNFASPFVIVSDSKNGLIEVDKSILSKNRGVIFFRFKPLFNYNTNKKVLLEILTEKINEELNIKEADPSKGFKVWYEYNKEDKVGYIQFRTSTIETDNLKPDESAWEIIALEQFWNTWHTIIISYDFDTKRFIYFFDYFKHSIDLSVNQYNFFTNLSIGKNAILRIENGEPVFEFGAESADILIKDLLITNYTTSDNELKNWINSHEFYKETLFNNLLNSYQDEMYGAITKIEGLTYDTYNIESNINILNNKVLTLESIVDSDIDLTLIKVRQDELRNEVYHNTNGILTKINILDNQREIHNSKINQNTNNIIIHESLIQKNTNNIALEVSDRINSINALILRLSSNILGNGASMIGIYDSQNKFAATEVESALLELEERIAITENNITATNIIVGNIQQTTILMQQGDGSDGLWSETNAINNGWNITSLRKDADDILINISTIQTNLSQEIQDRINGDLTVSLNMTTLINNSILDLAGIDRTNETVKGNSDAIILNTTAIASLQSTSSMIDIELNKVKDGLDGGAWDSTMNAKNHNDRLNNIDILTSEHTTTLIDHTSSIDTLESSLADTNAIISQETIARIAGDVLITTNLASASAGYGASLIAIHDIANSFVATTVEGALQEIDDKLQALSGSINWQSSVATVGDLPTTENNLNDSRIVQNDGDGKMAQYVWNGILWVKISDVDWGDATAIAYNNSSSGLTSTNVKAAIDELYERTNLPNNIEVDITTSNWTSVPGVGYYYDIIHNLETTNIAVRAVNEFGQEFGVDEIERLDANTVRIRVSNPINSTFTIFGAHNSYSKIIGSWTLFSNMYLKDIVHGFNTKNLMVSIFNIITGERIGVESIDFIDDNAIRVITDNNTNVLNVFVLKQTSNATTKDIEYWIPSNGMYESILPLALDYDAIYSFYDPITSKTVEVDNVKFESGMMRIRRTQNTPLRMVVLK